MRQAKASATATNKSGGAEAASAPGLDLHLVCHDATELGSRGGEIPHPPKTAHPSGRPFLETEPARMCVLSAIC
ncbi:MAG: hypothetical protein ACKO3P_10850, partial [Planctomycetaceae bacterium]